MTTKQHLIVLDLDGTLLTDAQIISPRTKEMIQKAQQQGHLVMIATGRPYRASDVYYHELGLNTPIVNFNGAYVHNPSDRNYRVDHTPIDLGVVHDVVSSVNHFEVENIIAEIKDDVYIHRDDERFTQIINMGNPKVIKGDLAQTLPANPTTMLIQAHEARVASIRDHLEEVHAELIDHRRWGAPFHIIEVVKQGLNKAVGLSRIAQEFGVPRDRIIAFGDEDNDLEMIEYAGVGVAMGNGISELKNIANEITKTNNEDGIALILQDRLRLK
ncbi:haloacid dehalogenase [Lysinibacillus alkalisoli]|uniref:Haloacid dehalogenase n=1 Tax=Lysinibacillus alkalisoli TaxID=1911548 RepID=A0A917LG72_9BACI|nr:Cof-type HAD-IIB family hydrolase [Lysinibacillus alkalisoli]GGG19897.1 haloacid dehalogenase [Lysinibacillus alkalisoli]